MLHLGFFSSEAVLFFKGERDEILLKLTSIYQEELESCLLINEKRKTITSTNALFFILSWNYRLPERLFLKTHPQSAS